MYFSATFIQGLSIFSIVMVSFGVGYLLFILWQDYRRKNLW